MKQVALLGGPIIDAKKAAPADELGPVTYTLRGAAMSHCGRYRYRLDRGWGPGPVAVFVMLNPSVADAERDDPTIKKVVGFCRRWGLGGVSVVNLFAYRATEPEALDLAREDGKDIVGTLTDHVLEGTLAGGDLGAPARVVAAWGAHKTWGRDPEVCAMATRLGIKLEALRITKKGAPEHPLYLPYDLTPVPFGVL